MAYLEKTKITDSSGNVIDPAKQPQLYTSNPIESAPAPVVRTVPGSVDDNIVLLRRIVKILESQAATDTAQRQRIIIDAIASGLTLGTVTTVSTVSNMTTLAGYDQRLYSDWARTAYNTGIRAGLTFS